MAENENPSPLALQLLNRYGLGVNLPQTFENLEIRQPVVTAHPDATAQALGQPERVAAPQPMQQAPNGVPSVATMMPNAMALQEQQAQGGPASQWLSDPKNIKMINDILTQNAAQIGPPKLVGKDFLGFGRGGIMGTGVEPIDVLAFALGAAITSRMPQDQALATTMQIAQLPNQYRKNQQDAARSFIGNIVGMTNAETGVQNAQNAQAAALLSQLKVMRQLQFTNMLTQRLGGGQPLSEIEQKQYAVMAHQAGMDAATIKELLLTPDVGSQLALLDKIRAGAGGQPVSTVIDAPGGQKITVGNTSSADRAPNTIDANALAMFGKKYNELPAGGKEQ